MAEDHPVGDGTAEGQRAAAVKRAAGAADPMTTSQWALLVTLSILWGGSFFLTSIALEELPTLTIVLMRLALASTGLIMVLRCMGLKLPRDAASWATYVVMGLLNNALPFCLITWAQIHLTSAAASVLNATAPFATLVLAHYCTRTEQLTGYKLLGVISGVTGVGVMLSPGWSGDGDLHVMAHAACLLAAFSYACAGVFGLGFRSGGAAPIMSAAGQLIAATALLLPVAIVVDQPFGLPLPGIRTASAVLGLAVFSTALAYIIYFKLLMSVGATKLLFVTILIPVSATFLGVVFLGEELGGNDLVGFTFVGAGLATINGRVFR